MRGARTYIIYIVHIEHLIPLEVGILGGIYTKIASILNENADLDRDVSRECVVAEVRVVCGTRAIC